MTGVAARRRVRGLAGSSRERPTLGSTGHLGSILIRSAHRWFSAVGASHDDADHAALLEAVAGSLRGGASLAQALREGASSVASSPAAAELGAAMALHDRGAPVVAVVEAWADVSPSPARSVAGAALALGSELGGARARALDGAAAALRDRGELLREVRALTSQARSSTAVMVLAPLGFALYAWTTDRRVAGLMFTTPFGWGCLAVGLALDGLGAWWMARLTARVT